MGSLGVVSARRCPGWAGVGRRARRRRGGRSGRERGSVLRRGLLEGVVHNLHVRSRLEEVQLLMVEQLPPGLDELVQHAELPEHTHHVLDLETCVSLLPWNETHLDGEDLVVREVSQLDALSLVLHDRPDQRIQFGFTHEKLPISPMWQRPQSRSPSQKPFCQIRRKYSINNKKIKVFSTLIFLSYQATPTLYSPAPDFHSSHYS